MKKFQKISICLVTLAIGGAVTLKVSEKLANAASTDKAATPKAVRATVRVTGAAAKTGSTLTFTTVPGDGLKVNGEGPWKLEIKTIKGATTTSTEYKRPDWKEGVAGFEVPATLDKDSKKVELSFKMTAFVCTKDKTMCYREVVEDKASVNF
ncbi:MAG: hypothetical protein NTV34_09435 [Proteobacteria bacterium]|nr:hypothetical protein [Pseudomonadota bacterium]